MGRLLMNVGFVLICFSSAYPQTQSWQQISNPGLKTIEKSFSTPPSEYGIILWWGWDGQMSDTVIKRDLERIKAQGFRGVMIEAGYGMDAKYLSPEWFAMVKTAVGEAKRMKADYWDVWSDLFRDNFFNVQAQWCRENNIDYIVHLNHEDQLPGLIRSSGDFFKNMRNVGVPGIDVIWSQIWFDHIADYPKLASSASHLYGKPRTFTESFAAFYHRPAIPQAKWVIDYQLVRGINSVQIMFMSASTSKRPQVSAPQSVPGKPAPQSVQKSSFFLSDTFPQIAQYINRATYLLSLGRPAAQIGVYFPTLSMWYGDNESNTSLLDISRQLLENQRDFDFVDEQALSSVPIQEDYRLINLSLQAYKIIIVPQVTVISKAAIEKLKEFAYSGGKVLFLGKPPVIMTGQSFKDAEKPGEFSWAKNELSGKLTQDVIDFLPDPDVKTGNSAPSVKYLHRTMAAGELYFFFNEGESPASFRITLSGKGKAQAWNAMTGQITGLKSLSVNKA